MRATGCQIRFKASRQNTSRRNLLWKMHLELDGTPEDAFLAVTTIERLLVGTLDYEEKGRALYYFALLNEHREKNMHNKVVRQFCCHLNKEMMKFMYVKRLPKNYEEIIGILIGKNGSRKNRMMKDTQCKIDINTNETPNPHYVIYGDTEENVAQCIRQVEDALEDAQEMKRKYH